MRRESLITDIVRCLRDFGRFAQIRREVRVNCGGAASALSILA